MQVRSSPHHRRHGRVHAATDDGVRTDHHRHRQRLHLRRLDVLHKIHHALDIELAARAERRVFKLLKASHTPNPAACVEDIRYLPDRTLSRDVVDRLASCTWVENASNVVILGKTSVGKSYLAQALVNAACRKDYTVGYWRLDDLGNRLAVYQPSDPGGLKFLDSLRPAMSSSSTISSRHRSPWPRRAKS